MPDDDVESPAAADAIRELTFAGSPVLVGSLAQLALELDKSNMRDVISRVPMQIEIALREKLPPLQGGSYARVLIAGLGGSASPVEILLDAFAGQLRTPLAAVRDYSLPHRFDDSSLVIVSSFSGNTEEVLSVLAALPADATNVVVVSAGGALTSVAKDRHYPVVHVPVELEPPGFQPRSAVGYFVTLLARLLSLTGAMDDVSSQLAAVPGFLRQLELIPAAEAAALWLGSRIPLVYVDEKHLMSIGRVAKIKFNENSKRPAFFNALPEANHNEMMGFTRPLGEFGILYLRDPDCDSRIEERFEVMRRVFHSEGITNVEFRQWDIPGSTGIEKVFAASSFADWCSYARGLLDGFDPSPVPLVESFKDALVAYRDGAPHRD